MMELLGFGLYLGGWDAVCGHTNHYKNNNIGSSCPSDCPSRSTENPCGSIYLEPGVRSRDIKVKVKTEL